VTGFRRRRVTRDRLGLARFRDGISAVGDPGKVDCLARAALGHFQFGNPCRWPMNHRLAWAGPSDPSPAPSLWCWWWRISEPGGGVLYSRAATLPEAAASALTGGSAAWPRAGVQFTPACFSRPASNAVEFRGIAASERSERLTHTVRQARQRTPSNTSGIASGNRGRNSNVKNIARFTSESQEVKVRLTLATVDLQKVAGQELEKR